MRIKKFDDVLQLPLALLEITHRFQRTGLVAREGNDYDAVVPAVGHKPERKRRRRGVAD